MIDPSAAPRVVAVGELLWDRLPDGDAPGGAPANVAWHAARLGASATLISRVGDDAAGAALCRALDQAGVDVSLVQRDAGAPTGVVDVGVDAHGAPAYRIREAVAWDRIAPAPGALAAAAHCAALCWGTLAQRAARSRATIAQLVAVAPRSALRVLDVNLREPYWSAEVLHASCTAADVLKVNDEELPRVAAALGTGGTDAESQLAGLAARYGLRVAALTRGAAGSVLCAAGRCVAHGAAPTPVVDTVGAGDAFTAALVVGVLRGASLEEVGAAANAAAAWVVGRRGAMPAGGGGG
jgi:fructokinase